MGKTGIRFRRPFARPALCALLCLAASGASRVAAQDPAPALRLGYNSHFSQGWPDRDWLLIDKLPADMLRDGLHWNEIERSPGDIRFDPANSGWLRAACRRGLRPVPVIAMSNPVYDGGKTIHSPAGRAAIARFVAAVADRFDGCVAGIELGNEINSEGRINGPAAANGPASYVEMLKAIWQAVKPRHPGFLIVGGGAHSVATGFLERMFALGGLDYMDAVAVHPYRTEVEGLDWELANLRAAMRRHGPERPIWATEFGIEVRDRAVSDRQSPVFMAKMVAVMAVNGVGQASWYALRDEQQWPNMGLFRLDGQPKPAALAFDFLRRHVLAAGPARRLDEAEPALHHIAFGNDYQMIWGAPRPFSVEGSATFLDLQGNAIGKPAAISETPFILKGSGTVRLGPPTVLADSLSGFGGAPWRYFARTANGKLLPLKIRDWTWSSDLVSPENNDLNVGAGTLLPAGARDNPTNVVIRLQAPRDGMFVLSSCVSGKTPASLTMTVRQNGHDRLTTPLTPVLTDHPQPVQLRAGDVIEWEFAPVGPRWPAYGRYRLRLLARGDAATCAESAP